ncbi:hypothetical protein FQZ97_1258300 [compost metagenome]
MAAGALALVHQAGSLFHRSGGLCRGGRYSEAQGGRRRALLRIPGHQRRQQQEHGDQGIEQAEEASPGLIAPGVWVVLSGHVGLPVALAWRARAV